MDVTEYPEIRATREERYEARVKLSAKGAIVGQRNAGYISLLDAETTSSVHAVVPSIISLFKAQTCSAKPIGYSGRHTSAIGKRNLLYKRFSNELLMCH